jgi:hypothetical protein
MKYSKISVERNSSVVTNVKSPMNIGSLANVKSSMRLQWAVAVLAMLVGGCAPVVSGSAAEEFARVSEQADRGWVPFTSVIDTTGMKTQSDAPPIAEVAIIGDTSIGLLAAGSVNGGLAIWRSDDFAVFSPLYNEVCCDRYIRPTAIGEFHGTLLVGGSGRVPVRADPDQQIERAFLLRSDDRGATWISVELPTFSQDATRIDSIEVIGDTVIVDAVDDTCCGTPQSLAVRSTDLSTWATLRFPGRQADDWPYYQIDDEQIFAVATRYGGPEDRASKYVMWRSLDEGRTFRALPDLDIEGGGPVLVASKLVRFPSRSPGDSGHVNAAGISVADPGGDFVQYPADVGQWGDGYVGVGPVEAIGSSNYALIARELRASPHYCYDDPTTRHSRGPLRVRRPAPGWVASEVCAPDGFVWRDVRGRAAVGTC